MHAFKGVAVIVVMVWLLTSTTAWAVTVDLWSHWSAQSPYGQALNELVREFNETHPQIDVKVTYVGGAQAGGGMIQKVLGSVAAGQPPDISTTNAFWVTRLFDADALIPFDEFYRDDIEAVKADLQPMSRFFILDGKMWAMQVNQLGYALYYNRDHFREAGLDPGAPPDSWEELVVLGKDLTRDANGDGVVDRYAFYFHTKKQQETLIDWSHAFLSYGGDVFTPDQKDTVINREPGVKALQLWVDLVNNHRLVSLSPPPDPFITGNTSMMVENNGALNQFLALDTDIGTAQVPAAEGNRRIWTAGQSMVIYRGAQHPDEAFEFIKWFVRPENSARFGIITGSFPARKSSLQEPAWQDYAAQNPLLAPFEKSVAYSEPKPNTPVFLQIQLEIAAQIERALYQRVTPQRALDSLADFIREEIKKAEE